VNACLPNLRLFRGLTVTWASADTTQTLPSFVASLLGHWPPQPLELVRSAAADLFLGGVWARGPLRWALRCRLWWHNSSTKNSLRNFQVVLIGTCKQLMIENLQKCGKMNETDSSTKLQELYIKIYNLFRKSRNSIFLKWKPVYQNVLEL